MSNQNKVSRRHFIKAVTASAAGALTYSWAPSNAVAADKLVVGALYVGPKTDYGWNQAHAEGVATLKKLGVKVIEEERVPETIQVAKSMESMIKLDNANLIFATSFGYWEQMLKTAEKFPKVQFLHAAPTVWMRARKRPIHSSTSNSSSSGGLPPRCGLTLKLKPAC